MEFLWHGSELAEISATTGQDLSQLGVPVRHVHPSVGAYAYANLHVHKRSVVLHVPSCLQAIPPSASVNQLISMRQLKHHEKKLLKRVDFLQWKNEHNLRELQVLLQLLQALQQGSQTTADVCSQCRLPE